MTDPHQLARTTDGRARPVPRPGSGGAASLVPVTVVGGYLGAGKTTLINALLTGDHGRRLAVLVNDFGSVNIDADLITAHDGETISLENGCVCCSIADAMGDALDRVLALDPPPEQIIIEASGVADPTKVAIYGQGWPGCRLDAVVVLVDAASLEALSDDRFVGGLVLRQLSSGDIVISTKADLLDAGRAFAVRKLIAANAPDAEVVELDPRNSGPDLAALLIGADRRSPRLIDNSSPPEPVAEAIFDSLVVSAASVSSEEGLRNALAALPPSVVRAKGFALVDRNDGRGPVVVSVQRVGSRVDIEERRPSDDAGDVVEPRLVLIYLRDRIGDESLRQIWATTLGTT